MTGRIVSALGNKFGFSVTNTTGAAVVIAILAAFFNTLAAVSPAAPGDPIVFNYASPVAITAAGYPAGCVADDGTPIANLVFTPITPRFSIRQFKEYIKLSGGLICNEITITADNVDVFEQVIEVIKASPLTGPGTQYLQLSKFRSVDQQANDKIVLRNVDMQVMYDTLMLMNIPNNRTVTFTFDFA